MRSLLSVQNATYAFHVQSLPKYRIYSRWFEQNVFCTPSFLCEGMSKFIKGPAFMLHKLIEKKFLNKQLLPNEEKILIDINRKIDIFFSFSRYLSYVNLPYFLLQCSFFFFYWHNIFFFTGKMDMESLYDYGEEEQDFYEESPGTRKGYPIDHRSIKVSDTLWSFIQARQRRKEELSSLNLIAHDPQVTITPI